MEFMKRHGAMAMAAATALGSMDMGSSTMDMSGASSTMDMSSASSTGMDLEMEMSMAMYFQPSYKNIPVLFSNLKANDGGAAFGIFMLLFFIGIATKGIEFLRSYLEQKVWNNKNYLQGIVSDTESDSDIKGELIDRKSVESVRKNIPSMLVRNFIRLLLCFIPELFAFALMLAAMSFTPVYFFAVVTGLAVGRFIFERFADRLRMNPNSISLHC